MEIEKTAASILLQNPGAVVKYRLLRDVLRHEVKSIDLHQARRAIYLCPLVQELANEQWEDGSWGAFHSRNSRRKQKIITTEVGVERALSLGLDVTHPILIRARDYILAVIQGEREFPDTHEKMTAGQQG